MDLELGKGGGVASGRLNLLERCVTKSSLGGAATDPC